MLVSALRQVVRCSGVAVVRRCGRWRDRGHRRVRDRVRRLLQLARPAACGRPTSAACCSFEGRRTVAVMGGLGWLNRRHLAELTARAGSRTAAGCAARPSPVSPSSQSPASWCPPSLPPTRSFDHSRDRRPIGTVDATFTVDPARVGANQIHIIFTGANGGPAEVDAAELTVTSPGVEPARVHLTPITSSHFTTADASFGHPGNWTLDLTVVVDGEAGRPAASACRYDEPFPPRIQP